MWSERALIWPFIGIDGCKAGWFCVFLNESNDWDYTIINNMSDIERYSNKDSTILIDIPIGFVHSGLEERKCDREARRLLGQPRGSSIFRTPARKTLRATSYEEACNINYSLTQRKISQQTWAILPKLREVDEYLNDHKNMIGILRECHPEVCFSALNNIRPMGFNKKTSDGQKERLNLLLKYFPDAKLLIEKSKEEYLRRQVALDDIYDALVAAITARLGAGAYEKLPVVPDIDLNGLLMEMVYYQQHK